jgi:hypothetical protein
LDDGIDWTKRLNDVLESHDGTPTETVARTEKVAALELIARSRIACLVGPAGTGKTTMLNALSGHTDVLAGGVLLLAPTGKARVQLADKVAGTAMTVAQYLAKTDRFDGERYLVLGNRGTKLGGWHTVVVDEASMLTEDMLASLVEALEGCRRLILVGDHRQLPPIGPGRPFYDLIRYIEDHPQAGSDGLGGGVAHLTVHRRQRQTGRRGRDDLGIADPFATDRPDEPAADEAFNRVMSGGGDGTVRIVTWRDVEELDVELADLIGADHDVVDADSLKRSLGATETYTDSNGASRPSFPRGRGGAGAEAWQVLTPVRARPGGVAQINRLVRRTWRSGDAHRARSVYALPAPMGPDEILFHDKVIWLNNNHRATAWDCKQSDRVPAAYANGEIGMAVHWPKPNSGRGKPVGLWVEFSSQPGMRFTFWRNDLDATGEKSGPALELAYGVTIHKAQGSQFAETYVVIPQPCALLSPELLYTALTRQTDRTTLLVEGDPATLRGWAHPSRSETARRLTFLGPWTQYPYHRPMARRQLSTERQYIARLVGSSSSRSLRSRWRTSCRPSSTMSAGALTYERTFVCEDGSWLLPDFTIELPSGLTILWEHLGMLPDEDYDERWDEKLAKYRASGISVWPDITGPRGALATSAESVASRGIDTQRIAAHALHVLGR